jgi:hypothetical protein
MTKGFVAHAGGSSVQRKQAGMNGERVLFVYPGGLFH